MKKLNKISMGAFMLLAVGMFGAHAQSPWTENGDGDVHRTTGAVLIGTDHNPHSTSKFYVENGAVIFEGQSGTGIIGNLSEGRRFIWSPNKAAIRLGQITTGNEDAWNENNTGIASFATGEDNRAAGPFSSAFGQANTTTNLAPASFTSGVNNTVSNSYSTAFGRLNDVAGFASFALGENNFIRSGVFGAATFGKRDTVNATAHYSFAAGQSNTLNGVNSVALGASNTTGQDIFPTAGSSAVAIGLKNKATAERAVAIGNDNEVSFTGQDAAAIGLENTAEGLASIAIGNDSKTNVLAHNSVALGFQNETFASESVAIGHQTKTGSLALRSVAMGRNVEATGSDQVVVGRFSLPNSDAVFVVGNGPGSGETPLRNSLIIEKNSGNVGIGTEDPGAKLEVNGSVLANNITANGKITGEEISVEMVPDSWPDYVFKSNYKLQSLLEVEKHIQEKGHLPNIPSAQEVGEHGLNLGEINAKLLEKIEELTLHTIQQQKAIEALSNRVNELEKQ